MHLPPVSSRTGFPSGRWARIATVFDRWPRGSLDFLGLAKYVIDLITVDSAGTINRAGMTSVPVCQTQGIPDWVPMCC